MKGKGTRAEKVSGRKVKGIQKSRGGLSGHYFPVSTLCSRNPAAGPGQETVYGSHCNGIS